MTDNSDVNLSEPRLSPQASQWLPIAQGGLVCSLPGAHCGARHWRLHLPRWVAGHCSGHCRPLGLRRRTPATRLSAPRSCNGNACCCCQNGNQRSCKCKKAMHGAAVKMAMHAPVNVKWQCMLSKGNACCCCQMAIQAAVNVKWQCMLLHTRAAVEMTIQASQQ